MSWIVFLYFIKINDQSNISTQCELCWKLKLLLLISDALCCKSEFALLFWSSFDLCQDSHEGLTDKQLSCSSSSSLTAAVLVESKILLSLSWEVKLFSFAQVAALKFKESAEKTVNQCLVQQRYSNTTYHLHLRIAAFSLLFLDEFCLMVKSQHSVLCPCHMQSSFIR